MTMWRFHISVALRGRAITDYSGTAVSEHDALEVIADAMKRALSIALLMALRDGFDSTVDLQGRTYVEREK